MPTINRNIEEWRVKNLTSSMINIGGIPYLPSMKANQSMDMLKHASRANILVSASLSRSLSSGKISITRVVNGVRTEINSLTDLF